MTEQNTKPALFDISTLEAVDSANMVVYSNGQPTGWVWTFAGPGHPKAVELSNRLSKERLAKEAEQEQARVNGRKWKADTETPEDSAERNASYITARLLGWSDVKLAGEPYPFTTENAKKLLLDPKMGMLVIQALEFLTEQKSFTKRSATL